MILKNLEYADENFVMQQGDLEIEDGIIKKIGKELSYTQKDMVVDCQGYKAVPGFVDIHVHGAVGGDCSDGQPEAVENIAKYLVTKGVTSFCPTTMAMLNDDVEAAVKAIAQAKKNQTEGAFIAGINLEGPFLAREKKGAQLEEAIIDPDFEKFSHYNNLSGGIIKLVDIAPEKPGGKDFIKKAKGLVTVSIAHTTTGYEGAKKAFGEGITHATHMFNAMSGLNHREPGVVGAIMDTETVMAEIICDGQHIHPAVVKAVFKLMGERLIVISDSMRLSGLEEGQCGDLGGQEVCVKEGKAMLKDGTIAGSVSNIHEEFKNLVSWGIPIGVAARAASFNPAKAIGMEKEIGSIKVGKKADIVILDEHLEIAAVYH